MAIKNRKLLRNLKKPIYVITICLTAIATIYFTGIHSSTLLANQTNMPKLTVKNAADLTQQDFPIGWFDRINRSQTPAKVAQEGINLLIPYTQKYEQQTIENYLDTARQNGVKVFLEPYREFIRTEDTAAIVEFVRTYKEHPAVAGWYTSDEPVLNEISPQTLEIAYQTIKAEDPNHPVAVIFAPKQGAKVPEYWNALDIYGINRYPLFFGKPEFSNLGDFGKWMQEAASYAGDKVFWPVIQGYGEQENGKPQYNRRLPTTAEERYMFYTAILAGADGLIFYGHHWTQQSWIDSVLTPIVNEFHDYLPIVHSDKANESLTNQSQIQTVLYQNPSTQEYTLIAIHHGRGEVTPRIELPVSVSNNQVRVNGENKTLNLTQGAFQDSFDSYEVRVYQFS